MVHDVHLYTNTIRNIEQKNQRRVQITVASTILLSIISLIVYPLSIIIVLLCAIISPCFVWSTIIRPEMDLFLKGSTGFYLTPVMLSFCEKSKSYLDTSDY